MPAGVPTCRTGLRIQWESVTRGAAKRDTESPRVPRDLWGDTRYGLVWGGSLCPILPEARAGGPPLGSSGHSLVSSIFRCCWSK